MNPKWTWRAGALAGMILAAGNAYPADSPSKPGPAAEPATTQAGAPGSSAGVEKLMMEGTEIQGTLEKPHVVYVIPWKKPPSDADEGISLRRDFRNEILEPVDRESFQRRWGGFSDSRR